MLVLVISLFLENVNDRRKTYFGEDPCPSGVDGGDDFIGAVLLLICLSLRPHKLYIFQRSEVCWDAGISSSSFTWSSHNPALRQAELHKDALPTPLGACLQKTSGERWEVLPALLLCLWKGWVCYFCSTEHSRQPINQATKLHPNLWSTAEKPNALPLQHTRGKELYFIKQSLNIRVESLPPGRKRSQSLTGSEAWFPHVYTKWLVELHYIQSISIDQRQGDLCS